MTKQKIASYIDHTLLAPDASEAKIVELCEQAAKYEFASVCVNPVQIPIAYKILKDTKVKVCTVIGFPLGANSSEVKAFEAVEAVKKGALEVDMVINIGAAKEGNYSLVEKDIKILVDSIRALEKEINKKIIVKVILETCLLSDQAIEQSCLCAKNAGADFVKTSTGFATPKNSEGQLLPNGATVHHVELMKKTVGDSMQVKASGGIRSAQAAFDMIKAGADRIGTSSGLAIINDWNESWQ